MDTIQRRSGGAVEAAGAFGLYLLVSFVFFGERVVAHLGSRTIGVGQDPPIIIWGLKWWPQAILEGWNPLHNQLVYTPQGYDVAWMTAVPGPSFFLAPLTQTAGPIVAFNVLVMLAPALNGWAAFLLCRALGAGRWPSLAGGYLFGFSSYVIAQSAGHANLILVFCIPLAGYLLVRHFAGSLSTPAFIAGLAATFVFQFLTSTEVFLTMTMFGVLLLGLALAALPDRRAEIWPAAKLVALALVITGIVVSPYLISALSSPNTAHASTGISSDLLNFVIPTKMTAVGGDALESVSSQFSFAEPVPWEQGAYFGLPLLLIAILFWRERRDRYATILVLAALAVAIAVLGPRLDVLGVSRTPLRLPWDVFAHLPLFKFIVPIRLIVYVWLLVAIMAALWLSNGSRGRWALGALAIVFLLPNPWVTVAGSQEQMLAGAEQSPWDWPRDVPPFFSDQKQRSVLDRNEPVVVLPYHFLGDSMLWQAKANMSFRMAGGFVSPTPPEDYSCWPIFRKLARGVYRTDGQRDFISFLRAKGVGSVVTPLSYVATASPLLRALPGERRDLGGVRVYLLPPRFQRHPEPGLPPPSQLDPDPFWCPDP